MNEKADEIIYPSLEKIKEYNLLILTMIDAKKADKAEILSHAKLAGTVEGCKTLKGDIHDKAAFLLKSLVQKHPFASGNRRTAFIAAKDFSIKNKAKFRIKDDAINSKIMIGIREGYYTDSEIKE
ncbi:MAG: Fic family protein [archaeon]|nr:Fic family protein [archaeon]